MNQTDHLQYILSKNDTKSNKITEMANIPLH